MTIGQLTGCSRFERATGGSESCQSECAFLPGSATRSLPDSPTNEPGLHPTVGML